MTKQGFLAGAVFIAVALTAAVLIVHMIPASAAAPAFVQSVAAEGSRPLTVRGASTAESSGDLLMVIVRSQSGPTVADSRNGEWLEADSDGIDLVSEQRRRWGHDGDGDLVGRWAI